LANSDIERRTIHLSIPFNRFCSNTGSAGSIVFDPETYTLMEDEQWHTTSSSAESTSPIEFGL